MNIEHINPSEIENRSFEIITNELKTSGPVIINGDTVIDDTPENALVMSIVKRCIHTTADFDYAKIMCFSDGAVERFMQLIQKGATIVTDTNMALSGINKRIPERFGCSVMCFMAEEDVAKEALERGVTRASVSMERAMSLEGPVIHVIGNAPTALITLREAYDAGRYTPAFVVAAPVGFVNVVAAKEMIMDTDIPYISVSGRKGGSNVAAAIVNAMLKNIGEAR